jgi:hypothetical protein
MGSPNSVDTYVHTPIVENPSRRSPREQHTIIRSEYLLVPALFLSANDMTSLSAVERALTSVNGDVQ